MKKTNTSDVIELVVYTIKTEMNEVYVNNAIDKFRKLVMGFEGFISYEFFQGSKDKNLFMDFVRWRSLEDAEEAARQVKILQNAPEYKDYIDSFESLEIFNHFNLKNVWN